MSQQIQKQLQMDAEDRPFGTNAIRIYIVSLLFYTASHTLLVLLPLHAYKLGASPSQIGLIMGAYMFTSMFLRPVAGKIVDKLGTRRVFTAALLLHTVVVSLYLIDELAVFAALRMAQGVILSFVSMVLHLMIVEALPEKSRGQGMSLFSLSSMLPYTYGPFLVIYFADRIPMFYLFGALIPLALLTLVVGMTIKLPERIMNAQPGTGGAADEKPYRAWADPKLMHPSMIMLLASVIIGTVASFLPLYLQQKNMPYAGLFFLTETIVLVSLRFIGRKKIPTNGYFPTRMIALFVLLITVSATLIRFGGSPVLLVLAAICSGCALSMLYPTLVTYVTFIVPERARGKGLGLFIAAADFGTSVGTMVLSFIADSYSYRVMFSSCIGIGLAALLLVLLASRRQERIG